MNSIFYKHPRPWYVYGVRAIGANNSIGPVYSAQIRDANHKIVSVSATPGMHAGAPLDAETRIGIANAIVSCVNDSE